MAKEQIEFETTMSTAIPDEWTGVSTARSMKQISVCCTIDWVELQFRLHTPSQPQHIQDRFMASGHKKVFVEPIGAGSSRTTDTFRITLQDPQGPAQVLAQLQAACRKNERAIAAEQVCVTGIEISLDVRTTEPIDQALVSAFLTSIVEDLFRFQALNASARGLQARSCPPPDLGKGEVLTTQKALKKTLENGWSINAGEKKGPICQRWYVKSRDSKSSAYEDLPLDRWSARYEITLREGALPFQDLKGWKEFEFASLRTKYFSWRLLNKAKNRGLTWSTGLGLIGKVGMVEGTKNRFRRKTSLGTRTDTVFGQAVKNALERLTRLQRRT